MLTINPRTSFTICNIRFISPVHDMLCKYFCVQKMSLGTDRTDDFINEVIFQVLKSVAVVNNGVGFYIIF